MFVFFAFYVCSLMSAVSNYLGQLGQTLLRFVELLDCFCILVLHPLVGCLHAPVLGLFLRLEVVNGFFVGFKLFHQFANFLVFLNDGVTEGINLLFFYPNYILDSLEGLQLGNVIVEVLSQGLILYL